MPVNNGQDERIADQISLLPFLCSRFFAPATAGQELRSVLSAANARFILAHKTGIVDHIAGLCGGKSAFQGA